MNVGLSVDVAAVESLRAFVAANAVECRSGEREMWAAIERLAQAYQSLVHEMKSLRKLMLLCVVMTCVAALSSVACFVFLLVVR